MERVCTLSKYRKETQTFVGRSFVRSCKAIRDSGRCPTNKETFDFHMATVLDKIEKVMDGRINDGGRKTVLQRCGRVVYLLLSVSQL